MNSLKYKIPLILKGHEILTERIDGELINHDAGNFCQLYFKPILAQDWFEEFCLKIIHSIGKEYLPIYRMADGEFRFISNNFLITIKRAIFNKNYINTCWGENYSLKESMFLKRKFDNLLKEVATDGILALHFVIESNNVGYKNYINKIISYFKKNKITLTKNNYYPFYFVYAFFSSEACYKLFETKNILLVSNFSAKKKKSLTFFFNKYKVKELEFYEISQNKSLLDQIDLDKIKSKPDIALIAGGIGSINIIHQLKPLKVPCIDVGFLMELYANEELKRSRIYVN